MRGVMILCGIALVRRFHFILYLFGVFLLITALRMFFGKHPSRDFGESWVMRACRLLFRVTPEFYGEHFNAPGGGHCTLTPLAPPFSSITNMYPLFPFISIPP